MWTAFAVRSILILLPEEPGNAHHEPLEGPQGKKGWLLSSPAAVPTQGSVSFYVSVCFVNSLFSLLPNHLHAIFFEFVLKNYFTLILTAKTSIHAQSVTFITTFLIHFFSNLFHLIFQTMDWQEGSVGMDIYILHPPTHTK